MSQSSNAPKRVTVTVIVDGHIHAGQSVIKGTELAVDEITAAWLVRNKIAAATATPAAGTDKKEGK